MPRRKKSQLRVVGHYMIIDGRKIPIDPRKHEELAKRCKLAWTEMVTGQKCEIVKREGDLDD